MVIIENIYPALEILEKRNCFQYDIIVMVQGDEPMVYPEMISNGLKPMLEKSNVQVTNLMGKIDNINEFKDQNCVKVVCDNQLKALYVSREPIPNQNNRSCLL